MYADENSCTHIYACNSTKKQGLSIDLYVTFTKIRVYLSICIEIRIETECVIVCGIEMELWRSVEKAMTAFFKYNERRV